MRRERDAFPRIRNTLGELQRDLVDSMVYILRPDAKVKELFVKNAFEVQENLFEIVAEEQLMRTGLLKKYFKAGELKKIEEAVNALKFRIVAVVLSGEIAQMRTEFSNPMIPVMKKRPKVTPFFVGRDKEIDQVKSV